MIVCQIRKEVGGSGNFIFLEFTYREIKCSKRRPFAQFDVFYMYGFFAGTSTKSCLEAYTLVRHGHKKMATPESNEKSYPQESVSK